MESRVVIDAVNAISRLRGAADRIQSYDLLPRVDHFVYPWSADDFPREFASSCHHLDDLGSRGRLGPWEMLQKRCEAEKRSPFPWVIAFSA